MLSIITASLESANGGEDSKLTKQGLTDLTMLIFEVKNRRMRKRLLIILFCTCNLALSGQNLPACDTLVINCCTYNQTGPNTITLEVSNPSSVLFDYPGFVLLDANMDTVAKEAVNYFGIGMFPQYHHLNILMPFTLPLTGYLQLYMNFYDSLACTFPFTIPDTTTGLYENMQAPLVCQVLPNPAKIMVMVKLDRRIRRGTLKVTSITGKMVFQKVLSDDSETTFSLENASPGVYFLLIMDDSGANTSTYFILE